METTLTADPEDRACEPDPGYSAGITAPPALLFAVLAPHPRNPREDLGDLTELTASVAAHGVYEPVVVLTWAAYEAAADADGDTDRPDGDEWTHVIVMGHRRAAAARAAGLAGVPYTVRDDLAGAEAIAAMIAENRHRAELAPLAEAAAMASLARLGWPQRKIAERSGCSQAHVSKRLTCPPQPAARSPAVSCPSPRPWNCTVPSATSTTPSPVPAAPSTPIWRTAPPMTPTASSAPSATSRPPQHPVKTTGPPNCAKPSGRSPPGSRARKQLTRKKKPRGAHA